MGVVVIRWFLFLFIFIRCFAAKRNDCGGVVGKGSGVNDDSE